MSNHKIGSLMSQSSARPIKVEENPASNNGLQKVSPADSTAIGSSNSERIIREILESNLSRSELRMVATTVRSLISKKSRRQKKNPSKGERQTFTIRTIRTDGGVYSLRSQGPTKDGEEKRYWYKFSDDSKNGTSLGRDTFELRREIGLHDAIGLPSPLLPKSSSKK